MNTLIVTPSPVLVLGFLLLPLPVGSLIVWRNQRTSGSSVGLGAAISLGIWMALVGGLAGLGLPAWGPRGDLSEHPYLVMNQRPRLFFLSAHAL